MPRHKMRKANAALNKGQMVRLVNERVVYVPPPLGRCCRYSDDNILVGCSEVTEAECCCSQNNEDCELGYGDCGYAVWVEDLDCDTACPQDKLPCCKDGSCSEQTPQDCEAQGGVPAGAVGETCADVINCSSTSTPAECCPTGRCCVDGTCSEGIREAECVGGDWTEGASCPSDCCDSDAPDSCCDLPVGLCCLSGTCFGLRNSCECEALGGVLDISKNGCPDCSDPAQFNLSCCPDLSGACCDESTGTCTEEFDASSCGGTFYPGANCDSVECEAPPIIGQCCLECPQIPDCPTQPGDGVFGKDGGQTDQQTCIDAGGSWNPIINEGCGTCPDCPGPDPFGRCCLLGGLCFRGIAADCGGTFIPDPDPFTVIPCYPNPGGDINPGSSCPDIIGGDDCLCGCLYDMFGERYKTCYGQNRISDVQCTDLSGVNDCDFVGCLTTPGPAGFNFCALPPP